MLGALETARSNGVLVSKRKAGEEAGKGCRAPADSEFVPWGAKFQASLCY